MANRWCEHDEVAAECLKCRLLLADATNEWLTIRLERALELLVHCASELEYYSGDNTHWEGCEEYHPLCKLVRDIKKLTRGEDREEDEGDEAPRSG